MSKLWGLWDKKAGIWWDDGHVFATPYRGVAEAQCRQSNALYSSGGPWVVTEMDDRGLPCPLTLGKGYEHFKAYDDES